MYFLHFAFQLSSFLPPVTSSLLHTSHRPTLSLQPLPSFCAIFSPIPSPPRPFFLLASCSPIPLPSAVISPFIWRWDGSLMGHSRPSPLKKPHRVPLLAARERQRGGRRGDRQRKKGDANRGKCSRTLRPETRTWTYLFQSSSSVPMRLVISPLHQLQSWWFMGEEAINRTAWPSRPPQNR